MSRRVGIVGGGWAGLAAATRLAEEGYSVNLFERSRVLGGRSSSFWDKDFNEWLDHGPHLFISAYREALRLLRLWGSVDAIDFSSGREIVWLQSDGRRLSLELGGSTFRSARKIIGFSMMPVRERVQLILMLRKFMIMKNEPDLSEKTVMQFLNQFGPSGRSVHDFLQTLCLAVMNAPMERAAAKPFKNALKEAFSASDKDGIIGLPTKPLKAIVHDAVIDYFEQNDIHFKVGVDVKSVSRRQEGWKIETDDDFREFDAIILAVPANDLKRLLPIQEFENIFSMGCMANEYSPITGIHCSFDRNVIDIPYANLTDSRAHWVFGRGGPTNDGWKDISFVISAAGILPKETSSEFANLVIEDFLQRTQVDSSVKLLRIRQVTTKRATVLLTPECERCRRGTHIDRVNLQIAGDWCHEGLPATIEGAARSGRAAAEAIMAQG